MSRESRPLGQASAGGTQCGEIRRWRSHYCSYAQIGGACDRKLRCSTSSTKQDAAGGPVLDTLETQTSARGISPWKTAIVACITKPISGAFALESDNA